MQKFEYVVYYNNAQAPSSHTHKIINKEHIFLEGEWKEHNMEKVCPLIEEWKTQILDLSKYVFY